MFGMFKTNRKSERPLDPHSLNYLISLPKPIHQLIDHELSEEEIKVPCGNIIDTYLHFIKLAGKNPPATKLETIILLDWLSEQGVITDTADSLDKWCAYARDLIATEPPLNMEIQWERAEKHIKEVSTLLLEIYDTKV